MGKPFPIPEAALGQHIAVIAKTGAGKTIATKDIVEHVVAQGHRVCILDTVKSDWWGMTSSADGKRAGLPFHILGGPRGHVPLHESAGKAIGELVASGALPLSIIDMADFKPGGPMQFFADFAPALFKKVRGVVYLVIEEAHELAPKERVGFGHENLSVHWAKKIATGSRSKGIRMIVATQRVQALHNAVLGSCDTLIAMRLTAPADQEPIQKWLKANVAKSEKKTIAEIEDELSSLPTGSGWVCSGEAKFFEKVAFPMIKTFDNSATPDGKTAEVHVKTAPVDQDKLRSIIGEAVKEAEANDPKALKAEVTRLTAELAKKPAAAAPAGAAPKDEATALKKRDAAFQLGIKQGRESAYPEGWLDGERVGFTRGVASAHNEMKAALGTIAAVSYVVGTPPKRIPKAGETFVAPATTQAPAPRTIGPMKIVLPARSAASGSLPGPQQRIVNSLATWSNMGHDRPTNAQVAWLARYSPSSTSYTNPRSALNSAGLIEYPAPDCVSLTTAGGEVASPIDLGGTLLDFVVSQLPGPERRILESAAARYPEAASNEDVALGANYSASSTSYTNPRSALKTKDLITYPSNGMVRAADWLFEGERS